MRMNSMPALRRLVPLLWLGPAVVLIGVVVLWPVVVMVQSSFQRIGGEGFVVGYNGTDNFRHLFDEPDFVWAPCRSRLSPSGQACRESPGTCTRRRPWTARLGGRPTCA